MRGGKPTPTVLKILRGNPGKRTINRDEPRPEPIAPDVPPELTDPVAIGEWRTTIVPAIAIRQVTAADRLMAISYCELWATWRSQLADAAKHAHVVAVGKDGRPTQNPARNAANKTLTLLLRVASDLGFSPASRSRVRVASGDGSGDDLELAKILAID